MSELNYHHLRYFREVAREGNLTRAAVRLNLSQSALSAQIRTLEERLGHALFDRVGRSLVLTEVGQIALDHADRIFAAGEELVSTLQRTGDALPPLRVGALSTLSRNFQIRFLAPVLGRDDVALSLKSGGADQLFAALTALALDVVLTTDPPVSGPDRSFETHRLDAQDAGLHGTPDLVQRGDLRTLLAEVPVIVPTESAIRSGFDGLVTRLGVRPRIRAEVDDMAMVRLLAREGAGLAVAPSVVFADEIATGRIAAVRVDLGIIETFYAVTVPRNFPHPLLAELLGADIVGRA